MTVTIINADVLDALRSLPDDSFGVVVTSPPYWGLRDYGVSGQMGLEPTLAEHLDRMVEVFAEVHRILKPEGICWVNYGDCYATTPNGRSAADTKSAGNDDRTFRDKPFSTIQGVLKPKDLCMVPNRFAIAMQEWGWWVRSEIIWAKPNPMPESTKDRPATAHEKIFMFTKEARYHYDAGAVKQRLAPASVSRLAQDIDSQAGSLRANGGAKTNGPMKAVGGSRSTDKQRGHGRNLRNYEPAPVEVWEIAPRGFKGAHFATFPPELVRRCLQASLRPGDTVLDPFGGAGTTGLVADKFGVDATLIEINPEYCALTRKRLTDSGVPVASSEPDWSAAAAAMML